ncbi:hypothetical protein P691DRAFT_810493 [Macrolepiota fuliginosa MF-IS2]|uniref:Uncharacterized protein n=1 Tax=Macrolepiota fuliginosa MF-IS2 TaxID=1400762 RepID=A0A9P6BYH7_9AGAR|nr:hypothetical protein P691DRAFT_810493 [Macrolepiota fuliginosa MF-IS2]
MAVSMTKVCFVAKTLLINILLMVMLADVSIQSPIRDTPAIRLVTRDGMCYRKCGPWPHEGGGGGDGNSFGGGSGGGDSNYPGNSGGGGYGGGGSGGGSGPGFSTLNLCPAGQRPVDIDACTTCCR